MPEMNLDELRLDGGTQARAEMNQATIADYAEAIKAGDTFPPLVLFFDGKTHWLAEGFHRVAAYRMADKHKASVIIRPGSQEAAILAACASNATHGLQRTHADKVKALKMVMETATGKKMSEAELAKHLHIPKPTIHYLKGELKGPVNLTGKPDISKENEGSSPSEPPARTGPQAIGEGPQDPGKFRTPLAPPEDPRDSVGQLIPERLRGVFARRQEINALLTQMSAVKTAVLKSAESEDPLYRLLHATSFQANMTNAYRDLHECIPFSVCVYCKARGCKVCGSSGYMSKLQYQTAPAEIKKALDTGKKTQ